MRSTIPRSENASIPACGIAVMAKASDSGTHEDPPGTSADVRSKRPNATPRFCAILPTIFSPPPARHPSPAIWRSGRRESKPFFQENLPREIGLIEAWHPNFGDCLFSAIAQLLDRGHRSAVVLNSDSPTLPTSLLVETAQVLARPGDRAVLGPANDGGYYLLGLKRDASPSVPGHRLEHGARGPPDAGSCRRAGSARARPAGVVRRGRHQGVENAAGGAVRGSVLCSRSSSPSTAAHARPDAIVDRELGLARLSPHDAFGRAAE